jgi:UDP-GlcNAc:undecaprenyl-phosphate GlcNAc-1-phosphate transferase
MDMMLSFILALSLSTVALPVLIRNAATWHLLDVPDTRKHHVGLIPRVGGIAIALGTLLSATVWSFSDTAFIGFVLGSLVIVVFGLLDDRSNLDFRIKFGGQIIAALIVAGFGIQLSSLPFLEGQIMAAILVPLSVVFLVATTNAFNLLDGLDGLAAGCGILSLATIGVLGMAFIDGGSVVFVAAAALGGILGFLRYNTHPAIVYMGDAGSQFLGFAIGALALLLIQRSTGAIAPAIILPILGLPIIDTLLVMAIRLREGRSPFSPDRNHIHHRLLALGLSHREAVAAIYLAQSMLVSSAIVLRGQSDLLIACVYAGICLAFAGGYWILHRRHKAGVTTPTAPAGPVQAQLDDRSQPAAERIRTWLVRYIAASVTLYMLVGAVVLDNVTTDVSIIALGCAAIAVVFGLRSRLAVQTTRLASYLAVIYVGYLSTFSSAAPWLDTTPFYAWLGSIAVSISIVTTSKARNLFRPSTQDLLTILVVIAMVALPAILSDKSVIAAIAVRALVFLYACELLITLGASNASRLGFVSVLSLVILATLHTLPYGV